MPNGKPGRGLQRGVRFEAGSDWAVVAAAGASAGGEGNRAVPLPSLRNVTLPGHAAEPPPEGRAAGFWKARRAGQGGAGSARGPTETNCCAAPRAGAARAPSCESSGARWGRGRVNAERGGRGRES